MRKLALVLGLMVASGLLVSGYSFAAHADDAAVKKCEAEKDAAKKAECLKKAGAK
jgi:hypothetical protein